MFETFWNKRRKLYPDENKYISLCHILEGSGETGDNIHQIFLQYIKEGEDYEESERNEMVKYLFKISKDRQ